MYLTLNEYIGYGGKGYTSDNQLDYEQMEFEARTVIDWFTFERLKVEASVSEPVKRCMYALIVNAERKQSALNTNNGNADIDKSGAVVAGSSNDGVSVSYSVLSASELFKLVEEDSKYTIMRYLDGVRNSQGKKLLYRGRYADE